MEYKSYSSLIRPRAFTFGGGGDTIDSVIVPPAVRLGCLAESYRPLETHRSQGLRSKLPSTISITVPVFFSGNCLKRVSVEHLT
jgi:hypothetical protein